MHLDPQIDNHLNLIRKGWWGDSELMGLLTELNLEDPPSEHDLYNTGWRGPMEAEVYEFDDYYVGC